MRSAAEPPRAPKVVLLCRVAGSGKTTPALSLEADGCTRLSIDEAVWARFGRYGVDDDPGAYGRLSDLVEGVLRERLVDLVDQVRHRRGLQLPEP